MRLVIPTRNRPVAAACVLRHLARFYPGTRVTVADGSIGQYYEAYDRAIEAPSRQLQLDYRRYDWELPLGKRLIDTLEKLDDDLVLVGADDDFPVIDAFAQVVPFLRANRDFVLAIGAIVALAFQSDGNLRARLMHARSFIQDSPADRVADYARWPFPTGFALVRREHLIERFRKIELNAAPFFGDFTMAFHDLMAGKILALPTISYFRTNQRRHSKIRTSDQALIAQDEKIKSDLLRVYSENLSRFAAMTDPSAEELASRLIEARIASKARPPQNQEGFGSSDLFRNVQVQAQYRAFRQLFGKRGQVRARLIDQLRSVVEAMKEVESRGIDNSAEPRVYSSLTAMLQSPDLPPR